MNLIVFIFSIIALNCYALTPIDGLIYGDIKDIKQYDPLSGVFSKKSLIKTDDINADELKKLKEYTGLFGQGVALQNSCVFYGSYRYQNQWDEENAKRSIAATLQYIGIDVTTKAIAKYAQKKELSSDEYEKLVYNLVENGCSKNISVYSIKFIKDNLLNYFQNESVFELPSIKESPFFSKNLQDITNSQYSLEKQFELSIKNFRAFCSWGGGTDDYRLLAPYLSNPFIMSLVQNNLTQKQLVFDENAKEVVLEKAKKPVLVACEDYICRRTDDVSFKNIFPKMIGSTDIETDFKALYCAHFRDLTYHANHPIKLINDWIKNQSLEDPYLEVSQFISLVTKIPDILISSEKYNDIIISLKSTIDERYHKWAYEKTSSFVTDLLYEESLQVDLVPLSKTSEIKKGEFQLLFDYSLGELDRVISQVDKIHSTFELELPKSYLRWIRNSIIIANNRGRYAEVTSLYDQFEMYIKSQLEIKKDLFLIPMWTQKMAQIISKELVSQLTTYQGRNLEEFSNEKVRIPIKFRYGLFALKYLRDKFKEKYR